MLFSLTLGHVQFCINIQGASKPWICLFLREVYKKEVWKSDFGLWHALVSEPQLILFIYFFDHPFQIPFPLGNSLFWPELLMYCGDLDFDSWGACTQVTMSLVVAFLSIYIHIWSREGTTWITWFPHIFLPTPSEQEQTYPLLMISQLSLSSQWFIFWPLLPVPKES